MRPTVRKIAMLYTLELGESGPTIASTRAINANPIAMIRTIRIESSTCRILRNCILNTLIWLGEYAHNRAIKTATVKPPYPIQSGSVLCLVTITITHAHNIIIAAATSKIVPSSVRCTFTDFKSKSLIILLQFLGFVSWAGAWLCEEPR